MRAISVVIGGIGTIGVLLWMAITEIPHVMKINPYYPFIVALMCILGITFTIIWMATYASPRVDNNKDGEK